MKTDSHNIDSHCKDTPLQGLTANFRDAVIITREMGLPIPLDRRPVHYSGKHSSHHISLSWTVS